MATKTGWATNSGHFSGVVTFDLKRGESLGMRFLRFWAWLREILNLLPAAEMIQAAENKGWKVADDNQADAVLLLEYAMDELGFNDEKQGQLAVIGG